MTRRVTCLGALLMVLFTAACTHTSSTVDAAPTQPTSSTSPPPSPTASVAPPTPIDLGNLPPSGIVATWTRDDGEGASFVSLDGRVLATVRGATIFGATARPGPVVVQIDKGNGKTFYKLDLEADQLIPISKSQALEIANRKPPQVSLPDPPGGGGQWGWSLPSDSGEVLGQWHEQVSECQQPVVVLQEYPGGPATPLTGDTPEAAGGSYGLGWAPDGPVVIVGGPCTGPSGLRWGVYIFSPGQPTRIPMSRWSYVYRLWGTR